MRTLLLVGTLWVTACAPVPSHGDEPIPFADEVELGEPYDPSYTPDEDAEGKADGASACPFVAGGEPAKKALFTVAGDGPDLRIEDELRRLVRAAVPGSVVRVSIYSWSRLGIVDDVLAAAARGVDVRIVVDGHNRVEDPPGSGLYVPNPAIALLRQGLGADHVVLCSEDEPREHLKGGCLSSGINHNKYALFSELCDGARSVVFQSSANLSASQNVLHNNAVVLRDDPDLYAGYLRYWEDEAAELPIRDYFREVDGRRARAFFFPRARTSSNFRDPSTDTIYNLMGNVSCAEGTRVRVFMAFWNDARDYLVDALAELRDQGCDVGILASRALTSDGVKARLVSRFTGDEARFAPHIHSKYLFVDGTYAGSRRRLVWTGSHNWVYGSIRLNEETILRVDDAAVFAAFDADWTDLWAKTPPP